MKSYITIFLFIFFFSMVSCQTTREGIDSQQDMEEEEPTEAADVIGEGSSNDQEEDLESEFADSEDFEQEMAEEAFPSEGEKTEEETAEVIDEEDLEDIETTEKVAEDATEEGTGETAASEPEDEDDLLEDESTSVVDESVEDISTGGVVINNIRYEAGENKIYIDGTGPISYQSRENPSNNQVVIEIPGAVLSESLQERPFVMKDFNTEMALLQADQKDSDTVRIVLQMRGNAGSPSIGVSETGSLVISPGDGTGSVAGGGGLQQDSSLSDKGTAVTQDASYGGSGSEGEVLPAKSLEEFFLHTPQFTGRPISFNFKDISVRDVLHFISEDTGLNMVLSDDVTGNISIKLRDVPWDQALVTVMKTKKLGYLREGNVIRIMSLEALKKDQEDLKKMMESQKTLDPLKVKVIPLVYTKVDTINTQLTGMTTKDRGRIVMDTNTNSLIVTDTARVIERIETMVKNLDKSPMQVMIEAKIIEARERFVRNLGISLDYRGTPLNIAPGGNSQLSLGLDGGLQVFPGNVVTGRTVSSGLSVSFAPVGDLDLRLGISEAEDLINVISAPRVVVLNGETAKITQRTQDIDLVTNTDQAGRTERSPERVSADLDFEVIPQITALGSVFMKVKMKRDFFGAPDAATGSRPINSREAETRVLVNNGQTIVIGGIYQRDETRSEEGFPILRHIPVLKWLFSRFTRDEQRNELLLFLTPRVMDFSNPENAAANIN